MHTAKEIKYSQNNRCFSVRETSVICKERINMKQLLILLMLSLSACGHLGEQFKTLEKTSAEEAIIYYYRPNNLWGGGVYYDVKENGEVITTLYNGGFSYHKTKPGDKIITAKTESETQLGFEAERGQTYFIRGKVHMGVLVGRPALKLVPEEKALKEIKKCRMIEME